MKDISTLIETLHIEDLKNKIHSSIFDENERYNMLILRIPSLSDDAISTKQIGFIIENNNAYYFDQKSNSFEYLDNSFRKMHTVIDKHVDRLLRDFTHHQDLVGDMENDLYEENRHQNLMSHWLKLKRDILGIERVLIRSVMCLEEFMDYYKEDAIFPINHYQDLHEHLHRILRSATFQLSKLDYIYNFYNAKNNEKMNRMVYLLTLISGIFLPLNLAVGFFGMNTSGLPFTSGGTGTLNALMLMGSFVLLTTGIFILLKKRFF